MLLKCFPGNSARAQCERLDRALQFAPVDTLLARKWLDILMPAARIFELRKLGRRIDTVKVLRPTDEGKLHTVALYVLRAGEVSI
ncbi:MAG: helix-turn-helix domain-containing protein [Gammaproteobacteria bacterium]|nr:helix-turn-helix domain-containing protein [Gammaproteobacteria bacterium]MBU1481094.1 helix-turn-helix domain-containing protein [Gammaproteobacteria bacterium]